METPASTPLPAEGYQEIADLVTALRGAGVTPCLLPGFQVYLHHGDDEVSQWAAQTAIRRIDELSPRFAFYLFAENYVKCVN